MQIRAFHAETEYFSTFLAKALNLVVGIEFVKMLCKHTPETLVEVLMFATARQMVVEHLDTWQTLIGGCVHHHSVCHQEVSVPALRRKRQTDG